MESPLCGTASTNYYNNTIETNKTIKIIILGDYF